MFRSAVMILEEDFIRPGAVTVMSGMEYSTEQLEMFERTMPSEEVVRWMKANEYMLVAGPPQEKSLLDIISEKPALFYRKAWYEHPVQKFSRDDKVGCGWLGLRKTVVPNSQKSPWDKQCELLSAAERVPTIAEVVWGMSVYVLLRQSVLMLTSWARTSSVSRSRDGVIVRGFVRDGIHIRCDSKDAFDPFLGIAAALKLPLNPSPS